MVALPLLYSGSVKDLRGPLATPAGPALVFEYSDAFSVFDWGRMPDLLPGKGAALAVLAASLFERLEEPESWREFSRSAEALALRKHSRFGAHFNELGEELQATGLRTHYLGVPLESATGVRLARTEAMSAPFQRIAVRPVAVHRPEAARVLGRSVMDYSGAARARAAHGQQANEPWLIPLEVIFRFELPPGSSLPARLAQDPTYLARRGFEGVSGNEGRYEFPILELFSKLEPSDRPLELGEAVAIAGVTAATIERMLLCTAWVAGWLRARAARAGWRLADGKLEWAWAPDGSGAGGGALWLVDAIGPDELRILEGASTGGEQLSKERLREWYRGSEWFAALEAAKRVAEREGRADWKRLVTLAPPTLPRERVQDAVRAYQRVCDGLSGRAWFGAPQ